MRFIFKLLLTIVFVVSASLFCPSCKKEPTRSSYSIYAKYNDGKIEGKLVYKFVNSYEKTFNHVVFNLHSNAYKENATHSPTTSLNEARAYPNGISYGHISIQSVQVDKSNAEYQIYGDDDEFLKVCFDELKKSKEVSIEIDFVTVIPNSTLRLGITDNGINLADFFPVVCKIEKGEFKEICYSSVGDPYYSDVHDYTFDLTVPSEYTVASSGYPTFTEVEGVNTTYSYQLLNGRDFAFVISKQFNVCSNTVDKKTFTYYGFGEDGQEMLTLMVDCVQFFSSTFGEYPYQSLTLAECDFVLGGMEYSGLCFINDSLQKEDKEKVIIHEIAHQWWHCAVSNDQDKCAYIDEGLAEYSTYLYLLARKGTDCANDMISSAKCAYKSFFSIEEALSGTANTTMERHLDSFKNEYEYANIVYNKSLIMFYEYGTSIGEEKAVKNLSKLYKENLFKEISFQTLTNTLGYHEHFKSYVDGKVFI